MKGPQPMASKPKHLTYAATSRCPCGAGLAYDSKGESGKPIAGCWDCSEILLGTADADVKHTARLPFTFYGIKPESKVRGTTRPEAAAR
jgi:hypothetical protein